MKTILSLLIIITGFMPTQVFAAASGGGAGGAAAVRADRFDVDAALLADPF